MSETTPAYGPSPEQSAQLADRTALLLRMLRGDAPSMALDALLSAYTTVAVGFSRAQQAAHMLRLVSDILERAGTPEGVQQALQSIPTQVLKVPMPEQPPGALPAGYAPDDVAKIEALIRRVLDLVEGEKAHNALSALITCYSQVADHVGENAKAGRVLLETGAGMIARPPAPPSAEASAPVPTTNANLH